MIPYTRGAPETDKQHKQHGTDKQDALAGVHNYKLKPTTYRGDCGTFEEREYKFQAYTRLRNGEHERLMWQTERATARITDIDIEGAAGTQEEATLWKQLSQEMKYILTGVTTGEQQWFADSISMKQDMRYTDS